ncbi:hypothetical protein IC575_004710 [Cucumis melo]
MVAMFLHVLAHDVKSRVIQREFVRSEETVSRHFNLILLVVLRLYDELIKKLVPITNNCTDQRWKCFKVHKVEVNFLGALDGTYIKFDLPAVDRPTFRMRKGKITTNVLGICNMKRDFVYVLAGWEGSAADSWILRDALARHNRLLSKCWKFFCLIQSESYHLQEWRGPENAPTTAKEYFNMKHSFTRNVIESAFGVPKGHWAILRGKSYYPLQV